MALLWIAAPASSVSAQEAVPTPTLTMSGGLTAVVQSTSDPLVRAEAVASVDLMITATIGRLWIDSYVEGNTTPRRDGVSRLIGEANTDAGTALNRRRRGRVQLSELRLVAPVAADLRVHAGLLDATGFLDVSRIANDENLFFLGVPFVNNPTIEFPDYAIGGAVEGAVPGSEHLRVGAAITGSNGLADNPNVSYAQLLSLNAEGKGVFGGASIRWVGGGRRLSVGAWGTTAARDRLDGSGRASGSYGVYSVLGWFRGPHALSVRLGRADAATSVASGFTGATYLWASRPNAIGLALAQSFASDQLTDAPDVKHGEVFARRRLLGRVFVTLSVQRIENSGFGLDPLTAGRVFWVPGIRLSSQF